MKNENILDEIESSGEKKNSVLRDLIPVYVVAVLLLWTFINGTMFIDVSMANYLAYGGALLFLVLYFLNKKVYIYGLLALFSLAVFSIVSFSFYHFTVGFYIGGLGLKFQPQGVLLLFVHLLVFRNEIKLSTNKEKPKVELGNGKKIERPSEAQLEKMKSNFANKSIAELQEIVNGNTHRDVAKLAASELIKEKQQNQ